MKDRSTAIVVSQEFMVPINTLWETISKAEKMNKWFFAGILDFVPKTGFETSFVISPSERTFTHQWKLKEVIEMQRIVYDWRYKEYPGIGTVTMEIEETPKGSRITVTNTGLESFPEDIPEFAWESCKGGWEFFIQGNLLKYLNGEHVDPV